MTRERLSLSRGASYWLARLLGGDPRKAGNVNMLPSAVTEAMGQAFRSDSGEVLCQPAVPAVVSPELVSLTYHRTLSSRSKALQGQRGAPQRVETSPLGDFWKVYERRTA